MSHLRAKLRENEGMRMVMILAAVGVLAAQHGGVKPGNVIAREWDGYGAVVFPIGTSSDAAARWANQGLRMVYAFNHPEAAVSFRKAAELDPECAMCFWGLGLALGNNINSPLMPENSGPAYEAAQRALALAGKAGERERMYVEALASRYAKENPKDRKALDEAYAAGMRKLADAYPDDLNAQVLYADALMNLRPWKLWSADGQPAPGTEEIVRRLESVLARDPRHMGANHMYIHAVEASLTPERALASADRLGMLAPGSGHLVHMPAHVYMRTGDYENAARVNEKAAELDRKYFETIAGPSYYLPYWVHNLHFLSAARSMQGRYEEARKAITEAARQLEPLARMEAGFEPTLAMPLLLDVRFQKWAAILARPEPASFSVTVNNVWHFTRGMAFASERNVVMARGELRQFRAALEKLSEERPFGLNREKPVMRIAALMLEAKIALAEKKLEVALARLREAVEGEDALSYDEPADWYYPPSREALGAVLLRMGQGAEAERVFRQELKNNRRSGRALYGLMEALAAQGKKDAAELVRGEYELAWRGADAPLSLPLLF
jgi:tetratricopeptide (TPR) repeat protein